MTVVMNHDLEPFFAGTYYPPESADGYRGFKDLMLEINRLWNEEKGRVDEVAFNITTRIKAAADESDQGKVLNKFNSRIAVQQISSSYDEEYGGFSAAPKFPRPGIFSLLLKQASLKNEESAVALKMLNKTLTAMAQGGIYDQVGGGFHRYSVDGQWQVPHFEKMLYSQALLTIAYLQLYELEEKPLYVNVARATLDFVLREMTSPQGGFYSALDADSERPDRKGEHAEGAFYLWSHKELASLLSGEELKFISEYYNLSKEGNIHSDPQNEFINLNILYVSDEFSDKKLGKKQQQMLLSVNEKLLDVRAHRPRPHLDDKIITAWNGMMISAFAQSHKVLGEKRYLDVAIKAAGYVSDKLIDRKTGKLLRRVRGGQAGIDAGLGDYVWYVQGLIKLYDATSDRRWLEHATRLTSMQNKLFLDKATGGYFDAAAGDSTLLFRSKSIYDGALPSDNSIALSNLVNLYRITKDAQWKKYSDDLRGAFAGAINNNPAATAMVLGVISE